MTRKLIGSAQLGERGTLYFYQDDPRWNYVQLDLDTSNGESATISLQHMPPKMIHKLADEIKRIAFALEAQEKQNKEQTQTTEKR